MGVVSFYGMQTGDLSVRLNKLTDMNIRIDETPEFEHPRTVLRYAGKKNYRDTRYEYIKYSYLNDIKNANGRYEKEYVLAFTFYLKNTSEASTIDQIQYLINFTEVTHGIDEALRVMVVVDEVETVYEKVEDRLGLNTVAFEEPLAARGLILNIKSQQIVRISVVIWLEGDLTDDSMLGGTLKLEMSFSIGEEDD